MTKQDDIRERQELAETLGFKDGFPEFMIRNPKQRGRITRAMIAKARRQTGPDNENNAGQKDLPDENYAEEAYVDETQPTRVQRRSSRNGQKSRLKLKWLIVAGLVLFGLVILGILRTPPKRNDANNATQTATQATDTSGVPNSDRFGPAPGSDSVMVGNEDYQQAEEGSTRFGPQDGEAEAIPQGENSGGTSGTAITLSVPCPGDWPSRYHDLNINNTYDCPGIQWINYAHPAAFQDTDWQAYLRTTDVDRNEWICLWKAHVDGKDQFPLTITYQMLDACGIEY